jgi:hypothetical protein
VLPSQSICLSLPVAPPSEQGQSWVARQQDMMRDRRQSGMPPEPHVEAGGAGG